MTDSWQALQEIFEEVCGLDEDGRGAALDARGAGNPQLRGEAERLVRAYDDERAANATARTAAVGRRFGAWQTVRLLGRGGMGEVWLAERADGEHEQQAALKILSPYLAAPDSLQRFRRERQLLARLEHPNIARLLDGGMSPQGEPYLVMEYVEGIRLDRYCEERKLTVSGRLELMIKVCAAVNSAHQYLVVHRDLKPGNILVTEDGEPKLLDFGIAKVLDSDGALEHTATQLRAMMLVHVGWDQGQLNDFNAGLASVEEALPVLDALAAADPENVGAAFRRVDAYRSLGLIEGYAGHREESLTSLRKAVEILDWIVQRDLANTVYPLLRAEMQGRVANLLVAARRGAEARPYAEASAAFFRRMGESPEATPQQLIEAVKSAAETGVESLCDYAAALRLALRADDLAKGKNPAALGYLAEAYALNHEFGKATKAGESPSQLRKWLEDEVKEYGEKGR